MEKEILEKAKKAVREHIIRMVERFKTRKGSTSDVYIDCPKCGRVRSLMPENEWRCGWRDCGYVLPEEIAPLKPREFERYYYEELMRQRWLNKKLKVMSSLFDDGKFDKLFE